MEVGEQSTLESTASDLLRLTIVNTIANRRPDDLPLPARIKASRKAQALKKKAKYELQQNTQNLLKVELGEVQSIYDSWEEIFHAGSTDDIVERKSFLEYFGKDETLLSMVLALRTTVRGIVS
jgi:hypothetical protein